MRHLHFGFFSHPGSNTREEVGSTRQGPSQIPVVALTLSRENHRILEHISANSAWEVFFADHWSDILWIAKERGTGVALIDRNYFGSDWKDTILSLLQPTYRCCVILISPTLADHLCDAFLEEGGYGVLTSPLRESEVLQILSSAWNFWKHCIADAYNRLPHTV